MLFPYSLFALFITLEQQYQDLCYQCLLHGAGLLGNIRLGSFVFFLQIIHRIKQDPCLIVFSHVLFANNHSKAKDDILNPYPQHPLVCLFVNLAFDCQEKTIIAQTCHLCLLCGIHDR